MEKIGIILTTFLRDKLMIKTVKSIINKWQDNYILLIGDQNNNNNYPIEYYNKLITSKYNIHPYGLETDCGLSYARNYLVKKANNLGINYCLISADSITFTDIYNFEPVIDFIKSKNNNAIVGFNLANRQPFEYDMTIDRELGKFILSKPNRGVEIVSGIEYKRCDIVKNFFIAPTKLLIDYPWDDRLKLCEHETFFNQLKENNAEVYYTEQISANYIDDKPEEYKQMRMRLYDEFLKIMLEINGMTPNRTGWLKYPRT